MAAHCALPVYLCQNSKTGIGHIWRHACNLQDGSASPAGDPPHVNSCDCRQLSSSGIFPLARHVAGIPTQDALLQDLGSGASCCGQHQGQQLHNGCRRGTLFGAGAGRGAQLIKFGLEGLFPLNNVFPSSISDFCSLNFLVTFILVSFSCTQRAHMSVKQPRRRWEGGGFCEQTASAH